MKVILVLVILLLLGLLGGFVWMIGLGILSHVFHAKNLAIGFWPSVLVAFVVNLLLGGLRGTRD